MAKFYNLEEAARHLAISSEELKDMVQNHQIRALRDGATMQFRVADVEELARRRGLGSDPEFSLSDSEMALTPLDVNAGEATGSEEINLAEFALGSAKPEFEKATDVEKDVLLDDLTVPHGMGGASSSSTILGMSSSASSKLPSDSDVRLVPDNMKDASDSDVRLSPSMMKGPSDSDVTLVKDDHSSDDFPVKASPNDTSVRQSPMVGSSAEVAASMSGSDFELTPSSVIDALQPESGSDFELSAIDASDEFDSTPLATGPGDSDVTAGAPADSGINLGKPSDSGINLGGIDNLSLGSASADSIQLAPLDDDEQPKGYKPPAPKAAPAKPKASLAATPPPSTRKGEKDIFEDTDFEVDALDSAEADDRTMQLEASSDFDLDESDSEVFAIDEEDVDENASTAMGPAMLDDESGEFGADDDDGGGGGLATSGWDVDSDSSPAPVSAGSQGAVIPTSRDTAEWGGLWVSLLGVGTILVLLLSFVSIDLVRNLYDYKTAGPASGIISALAGLFK